jgi:hypothetical protein
VGHCITDLMPLHYRPHDVCSYEKLSLPCQLRVGCTASAHSHYVLAALLLEHAPNSAHFVTASNDISLFYIRTDDPFLVNGAKSINLRLKYSASTGMVTRYSHIPAPPAGTA